MTLVDPYLLVRAGALYVALVLACGVSIWQRPGRRAVAAATLSTVWAFPALLALNVFATTAGWWRFDATGGLLLDVPLDLMLAWAVLWGFVPAVGGVRLPLVVVCLVAFVADLLLMPFAAPVIVLGPWWLIGETAALAAVLVPAHLLARWTIHGERVGARAIFQITAFGALLVVVIPAMALEHSGAGWPSVLSGPAWLTSLAVQLLAVPALVGLSAVQEFATRGDGTPVPWDPPRRLVTTGLYRYLRNPMQVSGVVLLLLLGAFLGSPLVAGAAVVGLVFSIGLAGRHEDDELRARFGPSWDAYRRAVASWTPRVRPWHPPGEPPARLYVSEQCGMCREVAGWVSRRAPRHLHVVAAETHPRGLRRVRYETHDAYAADGVDALARALEHIHIGWALVAAVIRLPVIAPCVQLLVDASGGEPRTLDRRMPSSGGAIRRL